MNDNKITGNQYPVDCLYTEYIGLRFLSWVIFLAGSLLSLQVKPDKEC